MKAKLSRPATFAAALAAIAAAAAVLLSDSSLPFALAALVAYVVTGASVEAVLNPVPTESAAQEPAPQVTQMAPHSEQTTQQVAQPAPSYEQPAQPDSWDPLTNGLPLSLYEHSGVMRDSETSYSSYNNSSMFD